MNGTVILDEDSVKRAVNRIAYEILEKNKGVSNLALIGILRRGVPLAARLAAKMTEVEGKPVEVGILDITKFRDDLSLKKIMPADTRTKIDFPVENKKIVLIDDVLFTGRTARAALDAVMNLGRPSKLELAVLIDRGHRELPLHADYVGKNLPTAKNELVLVGLSEVDDFEGVFLKKEVK